MCGLSNWVRFSCVHSSRDVKPASGLHRPEQEISEVGLKERMKKERNRGVNKTRNYFFS